MIPAELALPDACPRCWPGDADASLPLLSEEVNGETVASYECAECGAGWSTRFDVNGWPVERLAAPVAAREAAA